MYAENTELIESIRENSREFRRLEEKHREYEEILEELLKHNYLSTKQEVLKKRIPSFSFNSSRSLFRPSTTVLFNFSGSG